MFQSFLAATSSSEKNEDGAAELDVVFENERYYGIAWKPPALLERSKWTDAEGHPVIVPEALNEEAKGWNIDVNPSTDSDGWLYASVFRHLEYSRPGGRAERRVGDFVRRRKWTRDRDKDTDRAKSALKVANSIGSSDSAWQSLISPVTQMHGTKVRKQTELDRRKSAFKLFLSMLANTMKRRKLSPIFPIDPAAWMILLAQHHSDLISDEGKALEECPLAFDPSQTKPELEAVKGDEVKDPENMIRELVCAAVHSRAAYGHAMAVGHLNSVYHFALLQTLHQINFNPVGGASGEANNEAVAALAGIPLEDIALAEWHNSVSRPCHYVAIDRANHCIVISIRGSLEIGDILSDLAAKPMEIFGMLGTEGLVHEGMMMAATYVQCNTAPVLKKLAKSHEGWPVLITGHSMGGGVASILALLMNKGASVPGLGPVKCIAIGSAPVVSQSLAEACNSFTTSVVNGGDVVSRISYASVEAIFLEIVQSSPIGNLGKKVTQKLEEFKSHLPSFPPTLAPPAFPGLPSLPGLSSLTEHADDEKAMSHAARLAETAHKAKQDERFHSSVSTPASQGETSDGASVPDYRVSPKLSRSQAEAASRRLLQLRQSSEANLNKESAGDPEARNEANSDRAAASDILDNKGEEFRDEEGHPQPLYMAGRILWMLPGREKVLASQKRRSESEKEHPEGLWHWFSSAAHLACETLQGLTTQYNPNVTVAPKQQEEQVQNRKSTEKRHAGVQAEPSKRRKLSDDEASMEEPSDTLEIGEQTEEGSVLGTVKETPVVLRAKRDYFERILITMEMMQDHLPDSYLRVINSL